MKAAGVVIGIIVLIAAAYFLTTGNKPPQDFESANQNTEDPITQSPKAVEKKGEIKASFAIFTNGTFRIFTDSMYHNLSEEIFIESSNPNIIHVRKEYATWDDFFQTLPFKLDHECLTTGTGQTFCTGENGTLRFYINGEDSSGDALPKIINNNDKLLVTYGEGTPEEIESQIKRIPNP